MKRISTVALSLLGAATLAVALAVGAMFPQSASAQDATATMDMSMSMATAEATASPSGSCSPATFALLMVAQRNPDFAPPFDLSGYNLGAFSGAVMVSATAEATMAATAEATAMATESMTPFTPAQCEQLLTSVTAFLDAQLAANATETPMATAEATAGAMAPVAFAAQMSGPQEIPGPGDPDAVGTAFIVVRPDVNEICWTVNVGGINLPASAAHIHKGAIGESGSVVVPLAPPDAGGASNGCTTAPAEVVAGILSNPSGYYVNVHNADFPDGAVRGNLLGL